MSNADFSPVLKRFSTYAKLIYHIFSHVVLTKKQKLLLGAGLAYLVSPIDLIPGFIPVLGQLDDIIVALAVLIKVLKEILPPERNAYLEKFELTLETIERDLNTCKQLALHLTRQAVASVGKAVQAGGKVAFNFVAWGAFAAAKGVANYIMDAKNKK